MSVKNCIDILFNIVEDGCIFVLDTTTQVLGKVFEIYMGRVLVFPGLLTCIVSFLFFDLGFKLAKARLIGHVARGFQSRHVAAGFFQSRRHLG